MPYIGKQPADIIATAVDTTTGTFSGAVSAASVDADGGVTIDNITIDGTEIDLSSGSLTIDSAGDIILDAADGIITSTAGTSNVKLGDNAGNSIQSGGSFNILIGDEAGTAITTGDSNICVGHGAGDALTTGTNNVAVGHLALSTEDTFGNNVAIGHEALKTLNAGEDAYNIAMGSSAGKLMTTGIVNTLIGGLSGDALTEGGLNVGVGFGTLTSDTKGSRSTALGYNALSAQNFTSATETYNIGVGYFAGTQITTGVQNTLIGGIAGDALTDADGNVALGYGALSAEQQGNKSTAVGWQALLQANRGSSGDSFNTAVGFNAGSGINTGVDNTFIGGGSGSTITSGSQNTILGRYNGNQGGLDIRTSSNNIVLSDGDGNVRQHTDGTNGVTHWTTNISDSDRALTTGSHAIHSDVSANVALFVENSSANPFGIFIDLSDATKDNNSNYFLKCEDGSDVGRLIIHSDGDVVNHDNSYGSISDEKLKEQITDASSQWNDIKALKVRKFKMKEDVSVKGDSDSLWRLGVIAQEVETAGMNGLVKDNPDMIENEDGEIVEGETSTKTVKYSILYMKAVKALQEAMARIETLETKVKALEG